MTASAADTLRALAMLVDNERGIEATLGRNRPVRLLLADRTAEAVLAALAEAIEALEPEIPAVLRQAPRWARGES